MEILALNKNPLLKKPKDAKEINSINYFLKLPLPLTVLPRNKNIRLKFMGIAIEYKFAKWRCCEISNW
jgi:hypothetical protein